MEIETLYVDQQVSWIEYSISLALCYTNYTWKIYKKGGRDRKKKQNKEKTIKDK